MCGKKSFLNSRYINHIFCALFIYLDCFLDQEDNILYKEQSYIKISLIWSVEYFYKKKIYINLNASIIFKFQNTFIYYFVSSILFTICACKSSKVERFSPVHFTSVESKSVVFWINAALNKYIYKLCCWKFLVRTLILN